MNGMTYQWRSGSRLTINAQYAGEEIETLTRKANGQLTPAQVVDAARSDKSVLHCAFDWDDSSAAEAYREEQARYLIGSLVVISKPAETTREIRAFVSVTKDQTQGYTSLSNAMSDAELRAQVLSRAWKELQAWRERYAGYSELAAVHASIDKGLKKTG